MYTVDYRALVKYDHETGERRMYEYEPGWCAGESPFAPRAGKRDGEDDGYVVTIATHTEELRSEAWVLSARDIEAGPIARVKLTSRVPSGFHAKWIPGERLRGDAPAGSGS